MATAFDDVKPWPAKAPPMAAAPIGHNKPPMDVEARAAFDAALDSREGFRARVASLLGAADRASAIDNDTAGRCGELVKQIRAAVKVIEEAHATTKAPYLAAGRAVDAAKNEIAGKLDDAKRGVEAKQSTYLKEQEVIRQAELRRQREAEAARRREDFRKPMPDTRLRQAGEQAPRPRSGDRWPQDRRNPTQSRWQSVAASKPQPRRRRHARTAKHHRVGRDVRP